MKHTDTPWKISGILSDKKDIAIIGAKNGVALFMNRSHGDAEANAKYIVKCVNEFENLKNAVIELRTLAATWRISHSTTVNENFAPIEHKNIMRETELLLFKLDSYES